jgi:hypothetical protein
VSNIAYLMVIWWKINLNKHATSFATANNERQKMHTKNTGTPNVYYVINVLPDVVTVAHLVHEKTWKAIPCYMELHLPGPDCLRSHQCWGIVMDVMNASFGTDDWVLMSVYTGVPLLLPSATRIISSVPFRCYLMLCHMI